MNTKRFIQAHFIVILLILIKSVVTEPMVLWTQQSHKWSKIRGIEGDPTPWIQQPIVPKYSSSETVLGKYYGLSTDRVRSYVYWSETSNKTIQRQHFNLTFSDSRSSESKELVYADDSSSITAIAVDWLAGNVYLSDASNQAIVVATWHPTIPNMHKVLFSFGLNAPQGITVDPRAGYLFWSDAAPNPRIERSTMAGTNRQTIFTREVQRPMGVAADISESRVYWVDRDRETIESVTYNGNDWIFFKSANQRPNYFAIAVFQSYLFVSTEKNLRLHVYDKSNGDRLRIRDIDARPYHVTVHDDMPEEPWHGCEMLGCEHMCLNAGDKIGRCTCMEGYYLALDGKSCTSSNPRFIYAVGKSVLVTKAQLDIVHSSTLATETSILTSDYTKIQGMGFHYAKSMIFLSDTEEDAIYSINDRGERLRELTVQTKYAEGISVDWLTHKVYWTDKDLGHIMVFELDGRYHSIIIEGLQSPGALTVDAIHRVLIWTAIENGKPAIYRSNLAGTDQEKLSSIEPAELRGIVSDPRNERLYWTDHVSLTIESSNYDGYDRKTISSSPKAGLYDVTVFSDFMAWTQGKDGLQFGHIPSGNFFNKTKKIDDFHLSYDVITYDTYLQPVLSTATSCDDDNGQCQHHCYSLTQTSHVCGCAIGFDLHSDGSSCVSDPTNSLFLLYVDPYHKQIYQHPLLDSRDFSPVGLSLPSMDYPISMDYDQTEAKVYWLDIEQNVIMASTLNGSDSVVLYSIQSNSKPSRIAVDSASSHLFFVDEAKNEIYRMNIPDGRGLQRIAGNPNLHALAVDPIQGVVFFTSGNSVWKVDRYGGGLQKILDLEEPSALSMRPTDQVLYIAQRSGTFWSIQTNVSDAQPTEIGTVSDMDIYSVAAGETDIFFTAWNRKGVYRLDPEGSVTPVSQPIFARLTDIKIFEQILPLPVVSPPPTTIIIGVAVAVALLLLLLLLALFFALLFRRKKQPKNEEAVDGEGHQENYEEDSIFYSNGMITSTSPHMNGRESTYSNGTIGTTTPIPNGEHASDYETPQSPTAEEQTQGMGLPSPDVVSEADQMAAFAAAGIVITSGVNTIDKKRFKKNKQKGSSKPPPPPKTHKPAPSSESEFETPKDKKIATVIFRKINRLRNRLSSVRFSGGGEDIDPVPDPENVESQPVPDVQKPEAEKVKKHIEIPDKTHLMPRGYAPASHNVPRVVKTTWGKAKANKVLHKEADKGNKFGMQV